MQLLDERSLFLAELCGAPIAQRGDLVDARGATPARLRERQVHRYGQYLNAAWQLAGFFVETARFRVAYRRVERGNRRDNSDLTFELVERNGLQSAADERYIWSFLTGLELGPDQGEWVAAHSDGALAFLR